MTIQDFLNTELSLGQERAMEQLQMVRVYMDKTLAQLPASHFQLHQNTEVLPE